MKSSRQNLLLILVSLLLALAAVLALADAGVPTRSDRMYDKPKFGEPKFVEPLPQTGSPFDLSRSVIAGGGGASTGGSLTVEGTIGQPAAGTLMTGGQFSQSGGFWFVSLATATPSPTPTPTPSPTPTPTPNPSAPHILIEEGTVNHAVALDSVTFVRGPFSILTDHNFSGDHHTRVILFTSNLGLIQPDPSVLTVQAAGFDLLVENVGQATGVNGLDASYIVVRLPDGLPSGDLPLTVTLHGNMSNIAILSISP